MKEKQLLFKLKVRMTPNKNNFKSKYGNDLTCTLCKDENSLEDLPHLLAYLSLKKTGQIRNVAKMLDPLPLIFERLIVICKNLWSQWHFGQFVFFCQQHLNLECVQVYTHFSWFATFTAKGVTFSRINSNKIDYKV